MQKRFNSCRQKENSQGNNQANPGRCSIQADILQHKIKALEAKLLQQTTISDTLKFHNEEFNRQLVQKDELLNQLKSENSFLKTLITDLEKQVQARKKSSEDMIRQIRHQNTVTRDKNIRMCEIVRYLEAQLDQLTQNNADNAVVEEGLRKRVEQLTIQNENIRKKMAKSEVDSEKYKLKALEGEKYWSSKLERTRNKQSEVFIGEKLELQKKYKQQTVRLKADIIRLEKLLKIREEQISCLQRKIQQFLIQQK